MNEKFYILLDYKIVYHADSIAKTEQKASEIRAQNTHNLLRKYGLIYDATSIKNILAKYYGLVKILTETECKENYPDALEYYKLYFVIKQRTKFQKGGL